MRGRMEEVIKHVFTDPEITGEYTVLTIHPDDPHPDSKKGHLFHIPAKHWQGGSGMPRFMPEEEMLTFLGNQAVWLLEELGQGPMYSVHTITENGPDQTRPPTLRLSNHIFPAGLEHMAREQRVIQAQKTALLLATAHVARDGGQGTPFPFLRQTRSWILKDGKTDPQFFALAEALIPRWHRVQTSPVVPDLRPTRPRPQGVGGAGDVLTDHLARKRPVQPETAATQTEQPANPDTFGAVLDNPLADGIRLRHDRRAAQQLPIVNMVGEHGSGRGNKPERVAAESVRAPHPADGQPERAVAGNTYIPEPGELAAELRGFGPSFDYVDDLLRIAAGEAHGSDWIDSPDYWDWQLNWLAERGPRLSMLAAFSAAALEAEIVVGLPNTGEGPLLLAQPRPRTPGEMIPIYKFRSMPISEQVRPSGSGTAARASAIGRPTRGLSMDELPQYAYIAMVAARPILQVDRDMTRMFLTTGESKYFHPIPRDGVFGLNYPGCRVLVREAPAYHRARYAGDSLLPQIACRPVYDHYLNHTVEPYLLRHATQLRDGFQGTTLSPEDRVAQWFTSVVTDALAAPPDAAPDILDHALRTHLRRRTGRSAPADDALWQFVSTTKELLAGDYDFGHYLRRHNHPETEGYVRTVREAVLHRHSPAAVARVPFIADIIDAFPVSPVADRLRAGPAGPRPGPLVTIAPEFDPAVFDRPAHVIGRPLVGHVPAEPMWVMGFHQHPDGQAQEDPQVATGQGAESSLADEGPGRHTRESTDQTGPATPWTARPRSDDPATTDET